MYHTLDCVNALFEGVVENAKGKLDNPQDWVELKINLSATMVALTKTITKWEDMNKESKPL